MKRKNLFLLTTLLLSQTAPVWAMDPPGDQERRRAEQQQQAWVPLHHGKCQTAVQGSVFLWFQGAKIFVYQINRLGLFCSIRLLWGELNRGNWVT